MLHTSLSVKKSWAAELKVVQCAHWIEEERIAAPPGEKAVVAGFGYSCVPIQGNRRVFDDGLPAIAGPGGLRALDAAQRCGLRAACERREAYAVGNIGNRIAVGVDLDLVQRISRERIKAGRLRRFDARGRKHVHDQDRLAGAARLREGIQVGQVETGIAVGKTGVRSGIVVRHGSILPWIVHGASRVTAIPNGFVSRASPCGKPKSGPE